MILLLLAAVVISIQGCFLPDGSDFQYSRSRRGSVGDLRDITTNCGPDDPIPPNRVNTSVQLGELRQLLENFTLSAYILPLDEEGRIEWISGFSGSNAAIVITQDEALLWTDGRYFLQASNQLDCNWTLMRQGEDGVPEPAEWIKRRFENETKEAMIGSDPNLVGSGVWLEWQKTFESEFVKLVDIEENLIDMIWTEDNGRPPVFHKDIVVHPLKYSGEEWTQKVRRLREGLSSSNLNGMVVTEMDEVAWLFNIRGEGQTNLEGLFHSPIVESMALISKDHIKLWLHLDKVTAEVNEHFNPAGCEETNSCVNISEESVKIKELKEYFQEEPRTGKYLISKPSMYLSGASYAVYQAIPEFNRVLENSPILAMKSIKNEVESAGMMEAHIKDAVALCSWVAKIEKDVVNNVTEWTEISSASLLEEYRLEQQDSKGLSFTTISAFGSNGAVIHYTPESSTDKVISRDSLFLVDSGGQYLDGTTDVTRTFHFGDPTEEQRERYTDVLQGAIDLAMVVTPEGTQDTAIDLATRQYLFRKGLNFNHGTGHGIGSYLKVHEGPTRIAMSSQLPSSIKPGMFFSDEPGFYKAGDFGIRLETILKVVKFETNSSEYGSFMAFEPVTLVPFEPKLTLTDKLDQSQKDWLNRYNAEIIDKVGSRLAAAGNSEALAWLEARTQPV